MNKKKRVITKKDSDKLNTSNTQGTTMIEENAKFVEEQITTQTEQPQEETSNEFTAVDTNMSEAVQETSSSTEEEQSTTQEVISTQQSLDQDTTQQTEQETTDNAPTTVDQSTSQAPTDQPAVIDTSAISKSANKAVMSNKPEIIDTKDENLDDFEKYEEQILTDGVEHEKNLVLSLKDYLQEMKPKKPIHFTDGLLKQKQLLESIKGVLRIQDKQHFKKCWKILINYFSHHSKHGHAFHETYINRFTEHWSTGPDQLNAFRNLTHLLRETAQKGINNVHKTVSLENITKSQYFTEEERSKLLEFYNS